MAQNWHFWSIWARPCRLIQCPVGGTFGGCGAQAVSRKTPFYFMINHLIKESSYSILSVLCISLCSYFRMKRGRVALLITITVAPYLLLSGILSIKQLLEEKTRKAKDVDGIYNFSANELNVEGEHDVDLVFSLAEVAALPPPVHPSPSCAPPPLPSRPTCEGQTGGKLKNEK